MRLRLVADRPEMPEYGLLPAEEGRGLLPWSWAAEWLARSRRYWFASSRPEGRPHLMPIWGLWHEGGFYFSTARSSRKSRNLRVNPICVVSTEGALEAVILEGRARRVREKSARARVRRRYRKKYGEGFPDDSDVYAVRPQLAFGFLDDPEDFTGAATRWRFSR